MNCIHVMVGAIPDARGRILVAKRPDDVHQGGLWEFPGGKLEPGESREQGLARELDEELGIEVRATRPLIRVHHEYDDRHVLLDVYWVTDYSGVPYGREGQPIDWLAADEMDLTRFPPADRPIINALRLPSQLLITGPDPHQPDDFLARLDTALDQGISLVQLRAHALGDAEYRSLATRAHALSNARGARLVLNRHPESLNGVARHGLHLSARALDKLNSRPGLPDELIGVSCHTPQELARAAELKLDYALLSPVLPTATHPDAEPLGWKRFADWVERVALPVYALGGLSPEDLETAIAHGAQGIAAIRGLWPQD